MNGRLKQRREKPFIKIGLQKMSSPSEKKTTTTTKQELGLCDSPSTGVALGPNPTQKITA